MAECRVLSQMLIAACVSSRRPEARAGLVGSYAAGSIRVVIAIRFHALITVIAHTS